MKALLSLLAGAVALTATAASAQVADLSGRYRCVNMCRDGLVGSPAFITQSGWDLNLVNEAGEPSRAWVDWVGHIWVQSWNEGAIYSPDGMVIQFDRGTVWQRDLGEEVVVVERPRGQKATRRTVPPPVESAAFTGSGASARLWRHSSIPRSHSPRVAWIQPRVHAAKLVRRGSPPRRVAVASTSASA